MSGWYCPGCGAIALSLPAGLVTCDRCGSLGLRGFDNRRPRSITCAEHPNWRGWDDGGVNDDRRRHERLAHRLAGPGR